MPDAIYDPARLESLNGPVDVVLFSATSLKNLSTLHTTLAPVVQPNHTIILVDSTGYAGLHSLVQNRFPENPVCAISTQASVRLIPNDDPHSHNNTHNTHDPTPLLIHSGYNTTTWISPNAQFEQRLTSIVQAFQQAGTDASMPQNYDQLQWGRLIPMLAFQPLCVVLEAKTPQALINNVLSKPLYSGIMTELMAIASKHAMCTFGSEYLSEMVQEFSVSAGASLAVPANGGLTPSPKSSSTGSTMAFSPPLLDAPDMLYSYYNSLPIHVDLLLLQPILMADDYGIKTPYLESLFAFMSQMVSYNEKTSDMIVRKQLGNSSPGSREKELEEREQQLQQRERQLELKEQKLGQWSSSLQKLQHQQQRATVSGGPAPHLQQQSGVAGQGNIFRPFSAMPAMSRGAPPIKDAEVLDMMQITSRRNRRSTNKLRTSNSTASLVNMAAAQHQEYYHANNSIASFAGMGSRQDNRGMGPIGSKDVDAYSSITGNRYGAVDSSKLSKSRSNSLTMDGLLKQHAPHHAKIASPGLNQDGFDENMGILGGGGGEGSSRFSGGSGSNHSSHAAPAPPPRVPRPMVRPTPTPSPPAAAAQAPAARAYSEELNSNPYHYESVNDHYDHHHLQQPQHQQPQQPAQQQQPYALATSVE